MHIVIGLLIVFLGVVIFSNRRTRYCRWRAERSGDRAGLSKYRCMACGAEAFTSTGKPPKDCAANKS